MCMGEKLILSPGGRRCDSVPKIKSNEYYYLYFIEEILRLDSLLGLIQIFLILIILCLAVTGLKLIGCCFSPFREKLKEEPIL